MKRIISILLCSLIFVAGKAQDNINYQGTSTSRTGTNGLYAAKKGFVNPPADTSDHSGPNGLIRTASDYRQYIFNGTRWLPLSTSSQSGIDSAAALGLMTWTNISGKPSTFTPSTHSHSISNINGLTDSLNTRAYSSSLGSYLAKADTAAMLSKYARTAELPSTSGKLNISDTATMLSKYLRKVDTTNMLSPYARTAELPDFSSKLNTSDTTAMLSPYQLKADAAKAHWYVADDTLRNDSTNLLLTNQSVTIKTSSFNVNSVYTALFESDGFTVTSPTGLVELNSGTGMQLTAPVISLTGGAGGDVDMALDDDGLKLPSFGTEPTGGSNGRIYYNTALDKFRVFVAEAWMDLMASAASVSELNTGTDDTKFASPLGLEGSKYLEQDNTKLYATTTGTATAYVLTTTPSFTPATGTVLYVKFHLANTGAATINVNGGGAVALQKDLSTALVANDIPIGSEYQIRKTSTGWLITDIGFAGLSLSARLLGALSDETGSGVAVFGTSPSFTTSITGSATFSLCNTVTTNLSLGGAATTFTAGGTPTTSLTVNYFNNVTASGQTKALAFGASGASGSNTNVTFGSATSGANNTFTFNRLLTSGSTNDSLLVIDPSTGALKRISSARIAGGSTPTLNSVLTAGNTATNFITLTSDGNTYSAYSKVLDIKSTNYPGISVSETGSGSNHGWLQSMQADRRYFFGSYSSGLNESYTMGGGIFEIKNNTGVVGLKINNTASAYSYNLYGLPDGDLGIYGGSVGYSMKIHPTGRVRVGTSVGSDDGANGLQVSGGMAVSGDVTLSSLPVYADNAAATSGGLAVGKLYRTSTGVLMVRY